MSKSIEILGCVAPDTRRTPIRMRKLCAFQRGVRSVSLVLAALNLAPKAGAQTTEVEEPVQTFPEMSNSTAGASPASPGVAGAVAPAGAAPNTVAAKATSAQPATLAGNSTSDGKPCDCRRDWVRNGFYFRMLVGMGYVGFRGSGPSGSASISGFGSSSTIAIGGSIMRGLTLAGTLQSAEVTDRFKGSPYANATFTANGETIAVTNKAMGTFSEFGGLLDWYPSVNSGLHSGIGAGLGMVSAINQADDRVLFGTSIAATVLLGYDWSIAPTWALGVALVASGSTRSSLKFATTGNDAGYQLLPLSLGVSTSILYF
jgi:hypothetical protein